MSMVDLTVGLTVGADSTGDNGFSSEDADDGIVNPMTIGFPPSWEEEGKWAMGGMVAEGMGTVDDGVGGTSALNSGCGNCLFDVVGVLTLLGEWGRTEQNRTGGQSY